MDLVETNLNLKIRSGGWKGYNAYELPLPELRKRIEMLENKLKLTHDEMKDLDMLREFAITLTNIDLTQDQ